MFILCKYIARLTASDDLPLAVGPQITITVSLFNVCSSLFSIIYLTTFLLLYDSFEFFLQLITTHSDYDRSSMRTMIWVFQLLQVCKQPVHFTFVKQIMRFDSSFA